ncbi:MAG: Gfo/Idh/MocA family oxidoreductase [Pirellulaceae bacterium]
MLFPHVASGAQTKRIRIGQIGTKHAHASGKISAIRKLNDDFEIVGIVEPDEARRAAVGSQDAYRDLPFLTLEQLLNSDALSAVAVETTVDQLVPTAMLCLQAGKHIHLDKPAGQSMSECRKMHEEADRRGLTIQMGYMLRYNPAFVMLFDFVKQGWLGPITELNAMMGKFADPSTRRQLARFSGGGMFELACHLIDAMVTVLGKPQSVTAFNRQAFANRDGFVDNQLAVFEYPDMVANIRCNHVDPFGFARRSFEVVGEAGLFRIEPLEPPSVRIGLDRARGSFKKGLQDVVVQPAEGRYDDEFRDLAKVIRGEKELRWDSQHDLTVHEAVLRGSGMPVE